MLIFFKFFILVEYFFPFPMCLGFSVLVTRGIHPAIAASNSSKATSPLIFMATWGFCPSLAPASKPQKQQVPSISCLLGAFCSSNMKNSFCYHISEFFKSNKSLRFLGYLGLLPFPDACSKTAKATSSLNFMPTWGFCRSRTLAASGMTSYGQ